MHVGARTEYHVIMCTESGSLSYANKYDKVEVSKFYRTESNRRGLHALVLESTASEMPVGMKHRRPLGRPNTCKSAAVRTSTPPTRHVQKSSPGKTASDMMGTCTSDIPECWHLTHTYLHLHPSFPISHSFFQPRRRRKRRALRATGCPAPVPALPPLCPARSC